MPNKVATAVFLLLIPMVVFAAPKNKETASIQVEVVSTRTNIHGSPPHDVFSYTDVMFTHVNGKNVVYVCAQKGDACPLMQTGKTYPANQVGDFIYILLTSPDDKKPVPVKYKETGNW